MHEQSIIDTIISCLDTADCRIIAVSLICSEQELIERLHKDVTAGIRTPDVIERSVQRIPLYQKLNTIKVNTSGKVQQKWRKRSLHYKNTPAATLSGVTAFLCPVISPVFV